MSNPTNDVGEALPPPGSRGSRSDQVVEENRSRNSKTCIAEILPGVPLGTDIDSSTKLSKGFEVSFNFLKSFQVIESLMIPQNRSSRTFPETNKEITCELKTKPFDGNLVLSIMWIGQPVAKKEVVEYRLPKL